MTGKFIENLQNLFCKLVVHSGCALMERKELELLRNFLLKEFYSKIEKESHLLSDIEDLTMEALSEKNAKELFSKKCIDLEKTLLKSHSENLELKNNLKILQNKKKLLEQSLKGLNDIHSTCDSKISALGSEILMLRSNSESIDSEKKRLVKDFRDFRLILERIELEN